MAPRHPRHHTPGRHEIHALSPTAPASPRKTPPPARLGSFRTPHPVSGPKEGKLASSGAPGPRAPADRLGKLASFDTPAPATTRWQRQTPARRRLTPIGFVWHPRFPTGPNPQSAISNPQSSRLGSFATTGAACRRKLCGFVSARLAQRAQSAQSGPGAKDLCFAEHGFLLSASIYPLCIRSVDIIYRPRRAVKGKNRFFATEAIRKGNRVVTAT